MRDGHFLKASCGSRDSAAPEVMSGRHYAGPEVDVWSCGVVLYVLLWANTPFRVDRDRLYTKSPAFGLPDYISSDAKNLITRMLDRDPVNRISISEIRRHPWFQPYLPPYIAMQPNDVTFNGKKINEDIVREVVKIGFNIKTVIKSLQNGLHNEPEDTASWDTFKAFFFRRTKLGNWIPGFCRTFNVGQLKL